MIFNQYEPAIGIILICKNESKSLHVVRIFSYTRFLLSFRQSRKARFYNTDSRKYMTPYNHMFHIQARTRTDDSPLGRDRDHALHLYVELCTNANYSSSSSTVGFS